MRNLLASVLTLLLFTLTSCPHTNGMTVAVHLSGCIEPQVGFVHSHLPDFDFLEGAHFVMDDAPEAADATLTMKVTCGVTPNNKPGELDLTHDVVFIDPAQAQGEFAFTAVLLHEGTHWQISKGPHPERARVHPCQSQTDLGDPALCNADHYVRTMVMAATGPGLGTDGGGWNGDNESLDSVPNFAFSLEDAEFFQWSVTP